jgi:hypothetical protein
MAQMFAYFGLIEDTKAIRMATVKSGGDGRGGDAISAAIGHTARIHGRLTRERDLGDLAPLRLPVGVLGQLR